MRGPVEKGVAPLGRDVDINHRLAIWLNRLRHFFPKVQTIYETLTPASVAADSIAKQSVAVAKLTTNDTVIVNKPTHTADLALLEYRVISDGQLELVFFNNSVSPIVPPSEVYRIVATRL